MFFENYNNFIFTTKKVHSFKIFKRSTKFKRYNRGYTKFIFNRKKYALRKKKTTLYTKFTIPLFWSTYFSKKRQLIRFYQCYFMLGCTMSLVNHALLLGLHSSIHKKASTDVLNNISANSSFISKGILFNAALFYSKIFLNVHNFFGNVKIGFLHTLNNPATVGSLPDGNILNQNFFTPALPANYLGVYASLVSNLHNNISRDRKSVV